LVTSEKTEIATVIYKFINSVSCMPVIS